MALEPLLQHGLFVVILVLLPWLGYLNNKALKQIDALTEAMRLQVYVSSMLFQWSLALLLWWALRSEPRALDRLGLAIDGQSVLQGIATGLCVAIVLLVFEQWLLPKSRLKDSIGQLLQPLRPILPYTRKEKLVWVLVSCTAGIVEELLFRGFLYYYLSTLDLGYEWPLFLLLTAVSFGLAHGYQGFWGIGVATMAGVCLGISFGLTGNLAVPIITHICIDLRILFWPRNFYS